MESRSGSGVEDRRNAAGPVPKASSATGLIVGLFTDGRRRKPVPPQDIGLALVTLFELEFVAGGLVAVLEQIFVVGRARGAGRLDSVR